jgi:hypothetical protein
MKAFGIRQTFIAAGILLAISAISCNHRASSNNASAGKNAKPTPEESFTVIMDTFRRRMEDTPIGFVVSNPNGHSTMTGTNKVSYKLIPPASDSEPYKAIVTVESRSKYWVDRAPDNSDEKDRDKEASSKSDNPLADSSDEKSADSFDPSQAGKSSTDGSKSSSRTPFRMSDGPLKARPDELKRDYELVYQDGRWKLVTQPNPETEQAVQNAFKNALETQI